MWRLLLVLVLVGCAGLVGAQANPPPLTLTQQELDWVAANPVLRVGVFENLLPFEYISGGELRGLSAKYLGLITRRTGLHFTSVPTTTRSARKDMLISGEVDILPTRRRSDDPAEDRGILYTQPYNTSSTILVSRFDGEPFADLEQLAGKRLVMLGREGYSAFLKEKVPGITIISAQNAVDMMAMVKDGKADAAIASEWLLIPYLSRQYHGVLQVSGVVPQQHTGVSMAVRDDDVILLSILDKALASITGDERKAIYDAWFADMNLDIPTIEAITDHYESELWLLLGVVLILVTLVWQSRVQRRRATHNEREKAMFLAVMSHEIRSPMNAVLAAVELLEHTALDEHQRHFAYLANNGANALLRLVDDVLDISKMEAGQLKLNVEAVDLGVLARRVVDSQRPYAEEKGLELTVTSERPVAPLLLDELRVAQILRNLIFNAIKFTDVGRVEVQLQVLEGDRQLMIRVVDSSIGLSEQAQGSLFRPYVRDKDAYKRKGGTGLGLVVCRRLVKLMQGELTLSSTLGKGTQVGVMLPIEWAEPLDSPALAIAPESVGLRVLVVGGTKVDQHVVEVQLHDLGCEPLSAADITQGLSLFSAHEVDLVLMDCDLPEADGYNLAGEFRELERQQQRTYCPIIGVSQFAGNEHLARCFDAGMDGALSKPIHQAPLQQTIELWCEVILAQPDQSPNAPGPETLRKHLSSLLEAVALRDRSLALQAVRRLHAVALAVGWADLAATAKMLEPELQAEGRWPTVVIAGHLSCLVEQWVGLSS
ncbi:transporter substrate-binding domain-containing protein [Pseudomonas sp. TH32]|nr:transporter substrate-binding domain-containing protein [Pseudomonas sp. TH32]